MASWIFAVATWHNGRLYIMSDWYGSWLCADCEYEQMGKDLNMCVLRGGAFIYRHAIRRAAV